jgi:hypothetical protein
MPATEPENSIENVAKGKVDYMKVKNTIQRLF